MRGRHASAGVGLLVVLVAGGCFGDWVSARPRPRGDAEASASPKRDAGAPAPADPCAAYVATVAERCHAVLDGQLGRCHQELVRVMGLWHDGESPLGHEPRPAAPRSTTVGEGGERSAGPTVQACADLLRALPEAEPTRRPAVAELGPACRAWAEAVRERCVAPLASIPPDLRGCGPDLLAFEGILGAVAFGRSQDYEPLCRDAVERLVGVGPG